ncbi:MAG: TonB-dependent receptor [Acidobacteriota bacterium]
MRKYFSWRCAVMLAVSFALTFTGTVLAQTESGNLYGRAIDNSGERLPGVTVTLAGPGATQIQVTDASGEFRFLGLSPGNYQIEASLEGFSTVIYEAVNIRIGRNTTIEMQLSPAIEDTITVTTESPLLDERKITQGIQVTALELEKIPSARDPWSVAGQTPGVLMDRINVGGNESGQQPNFIGSGSNGSQNKFMIDGVDITDQSAVGASSTYFGFEQFEEMSFTTGGADVTAATPGVQLNMVTKRGTNEWRGSGSYNNTSDDLQSSDNLNLADVPARQQQEEGDDLGGLTGNQINDITQWGYELGGFVWKDRIWVWGSQDENDIQQSVFGGQQDDTLLENWAVKVNAQITDSNSFVYTRNVGEKVKNGRGASPSRPAETTWDQGGPSPLTKLEDTHIFNSSFFLTGSWSEMAGGFFLEPKGGRDVTAWRDGNRVWHGSYFFLDNTRPSERLKLDGSNFFNTGDISHELKWGASFREADNTSLWGAPGDGAIHLNIGGDTILAVAYREVENSGHAEYTSFWVQDTFTTDRLTVNVGLRYDEQVGNVEAGQTFGTAFDADLFPAFSAQTGPEVVEFQDLVPRLGVTYALGEERRTLLRASFSQFADQLGLGLASTTDPVGSATATYIGTDLNGNGILEPDQGETADLLGTSGFDAAAPAGLVAPTRIDPDIEAVITNEIILSVEHAFLPELVGNVTLTWREADDYYSSIPIFRDANGNEVLVTADDYVFERNVEGNLPDGTAVSVPLFEVRPGLEDTGGVLWTNTDRSTEYIGISAGVTKRLSNRWMLRAHFTYYDWEWDIGPEFRRFDNPTNAVNDNGGFFSWSTDDDGAIFAEQSGGSGSVDLFLNSRYSFNISGLYQLPWDINVSANINGREGYPLAFGFYDENSSRGSVDIQAETLGDSRVEDIITTDLRIDKDFRFGDFGVTLSVDVFNVFNEGFVLQREVALSSDPTAPGRGGFVDQIIGPRVARLGVRLSWK